MTSLLKSAPSNTTSNPVVPIGCFCLAIGPQVDSITAESDARAAGFFPNASRVPSIPPVASVPSTEPAVTQITRTGSAAAPPPKYIQFFISADSEGAGSVRWKAEWLDNECARNYRSQSKGNQAKDTGKEKSVENRKNAITSALEAALKESKKHRGRDHVIHFFRSAILELEKTGDIHLPMKKVKGLAGGTWTPDPEPLLDEMVSLREEVHTAGRG